MLPSLNIGSITRTKSYNQVVGNNSISLSFKPYKGEVFVFLFLGTELLKSEEQDSELDGHQVLRDLGLIPESESNVIVPLKSNPKLKNGYYWVSKKDYEEDFIVQVIKRKTNGKMITKILAPGQEESFGKKDLIWKSKV